jgi:MFS family permease
MTDPTAPAALGARDVLRIPAYRRLWSAQAVSDVGDGLTNLTLLLLVNELTGSTTALALMAIVLAVPPVTIGLVAGTLADRWDRRRMMLASDALRAVVVLGFVAVATADALPLLYVLAFVQATIGTFFHPARGALLPRIVPVHGLLAANSIAQATRVVAGVVGTGIAGVLVGGLGVYWPAFVLDALTFGASFLLVAQIPAHLGRPTEAQVRAAAGQAVGGALAEGLRVVAASRRLATTLVTLGLAMLGLGAVNVLFVPLLVDELAVSAAWFGPLEAAQSTSMILAAGIVAAVAARLRATTIVAGGTVAVGAVVAVLALVVEPWQVMVVMFAVGWFVTPLQAAVVTILQTSVSDEARGRVMSLLQASMSGASIASMAAAGVLAEAIGVREVFLVGGAVCGVGGLTAFVLYRGTTEPLPERAEPAEAAAGASEAAGAA